MAQASVIALELLAPSPLTVASYAAALATVSPAIAMVAATNRLYARQLAIGLERGDVEALSELRRTRLRWLVPVVVLFTAGTIVFAPVLMGLFGADFVAEGVPALRILRRAPRSAWFSRWPDLLKFTQQQAPPCGPSSALRGAVPAAAILVPRQGRPAPRSPMP
jgi:hypothetical protein